MAETYVILVTNFALISKQDTAQKASRQAHRWLRRTLAVAGEWATVLDPANGAVMKRYVRRADGRVERAQ